MIRNAVWKDIDGVERSYLELLEFEVAYGTFTRWEKEGYPTRETAIAGFNEENLYVYEEDGEILASMILNQKQPEEYGGIPWNERLPSRQVLVVHTLCVRPSKAGLGIGTRMVRYSVEVAGLLGCKAIRLDTGRQNIPAIRLYERNGFVITAETGTRSDGKIPDEGHVFLELKL